MEEDRYWINSETGRVIRSEVSLGPLWEEIDFDTYYALTHSLAQRPHAGRPASPLGNASDGNAATQ